MARASSQQKHLSDGELSDDDVEKEDLDTSICRTCNLTFNSSRVSSILFSKISQFVDCSVQQYSETLSLGWISN